MCGSQTLRPTPALRTFCADRAAVPPVPWRSHPFEWRALGTTERKVLMSYETAAKQSKHALHPADYDFLTKMMVQGKMLRRKPYHIDFILEDEDGKPWHAVLKATRAGDAIYLASLRRSHQSDVRRLHRRGQPIPEPGT